MNVVIAKGDLLTQKWFLKILCIKVIHRSFSSDYSTLESEEFSWLRVGDLGFAQGGVLRSPTLPSHIRDQTHPLSYSLLKPLFVLVWVTFRLVTTTGLHADAYLVHQIAEWSYLQALSMTQTSFATWWYR